MCFGFSKYGILDFGYSKHLSEILFCLFQTFIRDLVLSVPNIYQRSCFGCSKHLSEILFCLFQTFIRDLVFAVPKIRIIDLRIIFANTEILDNYLLFQTLELWILAFQTLEFTVLVFPKIRIQCFGFSKNWNSLFWLFHTMDFLILSFSKH